MKPWQIAKEWQEENSVEPFEERLGVALSEGYVWVTPEVFMLAEEVRWDPERGMIEPGEPNAWYVELAAAVAKPGRSRTWALRELVRVAPHEHEWVLWRRDGGFQVHAWRWNKLKRRV
jgi:hypothetical protein